VHNKVLTISGQWIEGVLICAYNILLQGTDEATTAAAPSVLQMK
jgi:hypothetical protein